MRSLPSAADSGRLDSILYGFLAESLGGRQWPDAFLTSKNLLKGNYPEQRVWLGQLPVILALAPPPLRVLTVTIAAT